MNACFFASVSPVRRSGAAGDVQEIRQAVRAAAFRVLSRPKPTKLQLNCTSAFIGILRLQQIVLNPYPRSSYLDRNQTLAKCKRAGREEAVASGESPLPDWLLTSTGFRASSTTTIAVSNAHTVGRPGLVAPYRQKPAVKHLSEGSGRARSKPSEPCGSGSGDASGVYGARYIAYCYKTYSLCNLVAPGDPLSGAGRGLGRPRALLLRSVVVTGGAYRFGCTVVTVAGVIVSLFSSFAGRHLRGLSARPAPNTKTARKAMPGARQCPEEAARLDGNW